jgi:hypothetical protein
VKVKRHAHLLFAALVAGLSLPVQASGDLYANDGVRLGTLVSSDQSSSVLTVVTARGYLVHVRGSGEIAEQRNVGTTAFLTADCSGQTYAVNLPLRPIVFLSHSFNSSGESRVMHVTNHAVPVELPNGSKFYQWTSIDGIAICYEWEVDTAFGPVQLMPSEPNDPHETGIEDGPFRVPFKLTWTPVFYDGFESTMAHGVGNSNYAFKRTAGTLHRVS